MEYQVRRQTPEFKALQYSTSLSLLAILLALYLDYITTDVFFYGMLVLFLVSMAINSQQTERVDESQVNL